MLWITLAMAGMWDPPEPVGRFDAELGAAVHLVVREAPPALPETLCLNEDGDPVMVAAVADELGATVGRYWNDEEEGCDWVLSILPGHHGRVLLASDVEVIEYSDAVRPRGWTAEKVGRALARRLKDLWSPRPADPPIPLPPVQEMEAMRWQEVSCGDAKGCVGAWDTSLPKVVPHARVVAHRDHVDLVDTDFGHRFARVWFRGRKVVGVRPAGTGFVVDLKDGRVLLDREGHILLARGKRAEMWVLGSLRVAEQVGDTVHTWDIAWTRDDRGTPHTLMLVEGPRHQVEKGRDVVGRPWQR